MNATVRHILSGLPKYVVSTGKRIEISDRLKVVNRCVAVGRTGAIIWQYPVADGDASGREQQRGAQDEGEQPTASHDAVSLAGRMGASHKGGMPMLADREFDEAVPKALRLTLEMVERDGTNNKLERLPKEFAHFVHDTFTVDIGEGPTLRRLYALTHVLISENRDGIAQVGAALEEMIETEL